MEKHPRILYAEDEIEKALMVQRYCKNKGIEIDIATSTSDVIELRKTEPYKNGEVIYLIDKGLGRGQTGNFINGRSLVKYLINEGEQNVHFFTYRFEPEDRFENDTELPPLYVVPICEHIGHYIERILGLRKISREREI